MSPRNHPGRANSRKITVAGRLENAIKRETEHTEPNWTKIEKLKLELERLLVKILPEDTARGRRTKKERKPKTY